MTQLPISARNTEIIKLLGEGKTLASVAHKFGISRERVSQIYYKTTGKKRGEIGKNRKTIRAKSRLLKKVEFLKSLRFICVSCGREVTQEEGPRGKKYCSICHHQRTKGKRDLRVTLTCKNCESKYHPYNNYRYGGPRVIGYFCKRKCYLEYRHHGPRKIVTASPNGGQTQV